MNLDRLVGFLIVLLAGAMLLWKRAVFYHGDDPVVQGILAGLALPFVLGTISNIFRRRTGRAVLFLVSILFFPAAALVVSPRFAYFFGVTAALVAAGYFVMETGMDTNAKVSKPDHTEK